MPPFEKTPTDVEHLLGKPIRELGLKLEGSPLEKLVHALYREIERKGLRHFRPACYLTDEWGCPSGEPVIGIPFYLADPKLAALEKDMNQPDRITGDGRSHKIQHADGAIRVKVDLLGDISYARHLPGACLH